MFVVEKLYILDFTIQRKGNGWVSWMFLVITKLSVKILVGGAKPPRAVYIFHSFKEIVIYNCLLLMFFIVQRNSYI